MVLFTFSLNGVSSVTLIVNTLKLKKAVLRLKVFKPFLVCLKGFIEKSSNISRNDTSLLTGGLYSSKQRWNGTRKRGFFGPGFSSDTDREWARRIQLDHSCKPSIQLPFPHFLSLFLSLSLSSFLSLSFTMCFCCCCCLFSLINSILFLSYKLTPFSTFFCFFLALNIWTFRGLFSLLFSPFKQQKIYVIYQIIVHLISGGIYLTVQSWVSSHNH